jgi:hypothetical protein
LKVPGGAHASSDDDVWTDGVSSSSAGWYHFNDASVTPMASAGVRHAWGGTGSGGGKVAYGANAYMLMYRKVRVTSSHAQIVTSS